MFTPITIISYIIISCWTATFLSSSFSPAAVGPQWGPLVSGSDIRKTKPPRQARADPAVSLGKGEDFPFRAQEKWTFIQIFCWPFSVNNRPFPWDIFNLGKLPVSVTNFLGGGQNKLSERLTNGHGSGYKRSTLFLNIQLLPRTESTLP